MRSVWLLVWVCTAINPVQDALHRTALTANSSHSDGVKHDLAHEHHRHISDPNEVVMRHGSHNHTRGQTDRDAGYIFFVMLCVVVVSQLGLSFWKQKHSKSFHFVTLLGLWLIPFVWSIVAHLWRMLSIWTVYSLLTFYVLFRATRQPLGKNTPRLVYSWFAIMHKVCYTGTVFSLVLLNFVPTVALYLIFYGLYYGVLGRDCAQVCTEWMAAKLGYWSKEGMPSRVLAHNICAICDDLLFKNVRLGEDETSNETVFTLSCGHQFHESCIRGWCVVGKRDTCAFCHEKVNVRQTFSSNPWETQGLVWGVILDMIRYLIVFNPLIIFLMQAVLYVVY